MSREAWFCRQLQFPNLKPPGAPHMTVAEYFAGIGLVRMGLESAGWTVVYANDIAQKKYRMYQDFFPDSHDHYVVCDVFHIRPETVPTTTLATCSFPCIDLSLAGNMNGIAGKHSSAFWGFVRILTAQSSSAPPYLLVENVPGWLHSNNGGDFRTTIQALNGMGYSCDVLTLDALRFVPQSRLRVFVIAARLGRVDNGLELILNRPRSLLSDNLKTNLVANADLQWFGAHIPDPPPLRSGGLRNIVEVMADLDPRWWPDEEVTRHLSMMDESHYSRVNALKSAGQISYRTFFRRRRKGKQRAEVRKDDISGCLRTAIGGSGKQFLLSMGKGQIKMRSMTPREYARLQGIPDSYAMTVNGVQALTGLGDAVCVPAIRWLAQNVLNPMLSAGQTDRRA